MVAFFIAYLLRKDQGVLDELVEARLQQALVVTKGRLGGVVEEIRRLDEVVLLVADDCALEVVEREEIGDLLGVRVLDHVCPHHLLLCVLLVEHPVLELLLVEFLCHVHALEVSLQEVQHRLGILGLEGANTGLDGLLRKLVSDDLALLCAAVRQRREAHIVQLLPFECAVEIPACRDRSG